MTQANNTTNSHKGTHLSYKERMTIEVLIQEKYSVRKMSIRLKRTRKTIKNEIDRGTITQLKRQKQNGKIYDYYTEVYSADAGQTIYDENRLNSGRRPKWLDSDKFTEWADDMMLNEKWSPDTVVGYAKENELFDPSIIPCTTTLYTWIDRGIMLTTNMDLLEKLSRKPNKRKPNPSENKRVLGPSIETRPVEIAKRNCFGHWEIDTVIGSKAKTDSVLLTLVERKTRFELIIKLDGKDSASVDHAIQELRNRAGDNFEFLFKTITSDNGSEFSGLHESLKDVLNVYFAHPYASWERGTSENQHKLIRRFIPKGRPINKIGETQIKRIQQWMNDYPRKILGYDTPHNLFAKEFRKAKLAA